MVGAANRFLSEKKATQFLRHDPPARTAFLITLFECGMIP